MTNDILKIATILLLSILASSLSGQIWYKLDLLEDGETYQISLISDQDWGMPNNITSTGQITIKAPTLEMDVTDFESVNPLFEWQYNSRLNAPEESTDFDYFSFGLKQASRDFDYDAGVEVPIIQFKNGKGCSDFIRLIDNENDPFIFSDDKVINVGNQLTVLGAQGNAYMGNKGQELVKCNKEFLQVEKVMQGYKLFPNPASSMVNIHFDWKQRAQAGQFFVRDNAGKVVLYEQRNLEEGLNEVQLDISFLGGGIYHLELVDANKESIPLERFVKVLSASLDEEEEDKKDGKIRN